MHYDISRRQSRRIPTSAERLNQQDAGRHSPGENVERASFVLKSNGLGGNHLQVVGRARFVLFS